MSSSFVQFAVWEWINIALEYAAVAWVRLPRLFLAVAAVNLVTHPILTLLLARHGRDQAFVLACEAIVVAAEWLMLVAVYGRSRWRFLGAVALVMNVVSYGTGLLLKL